MSRTLVVALAITMAGTAGGTPPVVSWGDAGNYVGEIVTVEGDVAAAHTTDDGCVLEFSDDPHAFRVVLLVPLLSSLPRQPDRLYRGARVRVSGRVLRFGGRPEMVLRDPDQIAIAGVAPTDATTPRPPAPTAPSPGASPPAPAPPDVAPPATPDAPAPRAVSDAAPSESHTPFDPCTSAHARWRDTAARLSARTAELQRCLSAASYRCRADGEAMAPALAALEWAERQVEDACR